MRRFENHNTRNVSDEKLGKNVLKPREKWMKQEILDEIRERNYWTKQYVDRYKQLINHKYNRMQEGKRVGNERK